MTLSTSVSPRSRHRFFRRITFGLGLLAALALANSTSQSQAAQISFHQVGLPDAVSSWYQHISADGSTVIGSSQTQTGQQQAFVWTADTGIVGLSLGGNDSWASAISADGLTVVGESQTPAGNYQAFVWTAASDIVGLPTEPGWNSWAADVSEVSSRIVGETWDWNGFGEAVLWDHLHGMRSVTDILTDSGVDVGGFRLASAQRISRDGSTIVGAGQTAEGRWSAWVAVLPVNDPPVAIASIVVDGVDEGTSVELPCDDHEGVTVTLDGSGSHDRDGDDLEYEWSVAEDSGIVIGDPTDAITDVQFPVGVHEVTLTVFDLDENGNRRGTLDVTAVQVVVIDETPPVALVTADLVALWPANNKLVPVEVTVFASDQCTDPDDLLVFCTITSSQPDDSDGTGKLVGDVDGFDGYSAAVDITLTNHGDGTYSTVVWLRAERDGNDKAGRVYSINATAIDWSGNVGNASSTVIVPHSQAGGKK